jgi:restriction endonuclease Mrr
MSIASAERKILVTTSEFTDQAKQEASFTQTELIDGAKLEIMIARNLPDYFT